MPFPSSVQTTLKSAALAVAALPFAALADTPNVEPGLWEYTATTAIEGGPISLPPNENVYRQCLTQEDLQEPDFLMSDMDECQISDLQVGRDGMSYNMVCTETESGSSVAMQAEASFLGDRMTGTMNGEMETPMGVMTMVVSQEGRRISDCEE